MAELTREQAIDLVGQLGDAGLARVSAATRIHQHAGETEVRLALVYALLRRTSCSDLRTEAARMLGQLEDRGDGVAAALTLALRTDKDVYVRDAAARSLGQLGSGEASEALEQARQKDEARLVRCSAAIALGALEQSEAAPAWRSGR